MWKKAWIVGCICLLGWAGLAGAESPSVEVSLSLSELEAEWFGAPDVLWSAEEVTLSCLCPSGQIGTLSSSCDTSVVCKLPDGSSGNVKVTSCICCTQCQSISCPIPQCESRVVSASCGC